MKVGMRALRWLAMFCLCTISVEAFSSGAPAGYYSTYQKDLSGNIKDVYVVAKQTVAVTGFFPLTTFMFTPSVPAYIFSVYPDGSIGNLRTTQLTWKDMAALGATASDYKILAGDFRGIGQQNLLLQGSGANHSFVITLDSVAPYIYYDFGTQFNSAQAQLAIVDYNADGHSDIQLQTAGNSYIIPSLSYGALFDLSALKSTPSSAGGPPAVAASTSACYPGAADVTAARAPDLSVTATQIDNSAEIAALAKTLGYSPLKILEYVVNQIDYEPYQGAEQGALATLKAKRGNDIDHASLLIALLRASNIPARYVTGVIYLEDLPQHYYWHKALNFFGMDWILAYNNQLNVTTLTNFNGRNTLQAHHVWVEACVPYENYRGTKVVDSAGRWLPMDGSFKRYVPDQGIVNTSVPFNFDQYLSARTKTLPLEAYLEDLLAAARTTNPDATAKDLGTNWHRSDVDLEFLPDSLPYTVYSSTSRYSTAIDSWIKYAHLDFEGQGVDIPYSTFAKGRVTLSFEDVAAVNVADYLQDAQSYANFPGGVIPPSAYNAVPQTNFLKSYRQSGQTACTGPAQTQPVIRVDGVAVTGFKVPTQNVATPGIPPLLGQHTSGYYSTLSLAKVPACLPYAASCQTSQVCSSWTQETPPPYCVPDQYVWVPVNSIYPPYRSEQVFVPGYCLPQFPRLVCSGYEAVTTCNTTAWTPLRNTYTLKVTPQLNNRTLVGGAIYQNKISPLEYYSLQVYTPNQSDDFLAERFKRFSKNLQAVTDPWDNPDEIVGEYLHIVGRKYIRYVDEGNHLAGKLLGETGQMSEATVLTSLRSTIQFMYDTPYALFSDGYLVDAFGVTNSANISGDPMSDKMLALSGVNGSAYESYIWQENANADAVSTVTGLQMAQTLVKPDPQRPAVTDAVRTVHNVSELQNFLTICAQATPGQIVKCYDQATVNDIKSWFTGAAGEQMTIPREVLSVPGFYGYVYLADKPNLKTYAISQSKGGYSIPSYNNSFIDFGNYSSIGFNYNWNDYNLTSNADFYSTGWHMDWTSSSSDWSKSTSLSTVDAFDFSNYGIEYFTNNSLPSVVNSGVNYGVSDYATWAGDPVNMVTGNMYKQETDFSIPARGLPLTFLRSYNSRDIQEDGPLGHGWTHSFNQSLKFVADSATGTKPTDIIWTTADGGKRYIKLATGAAFINGNLNITPGVVTIPKGFYFSLSRPYQSGQPAEIIVTEKSGMKYRFQAVAGTVNSVAKLTAIDDGKGNQISLNYDSSGRLISVVDPDARQIVLAYSAANPTHISTVTLGWSNEVYSYDYDYYDQLVAYHNPLDGARHVGTSNYSYYSPNEGNNAFRRMKGYSSANGAGMTFEYYVNGKVYRHYNDKGETQTFNYNDYRRETIATDERGNKTQYLFNPDGQPLEIVEPNGAKTSYRYENTSDPMLRTAIVDPLGQETLYSYDANGNITQETLPSGKTTKYFYYNSFGKPQLIKNAADDYRLNLFDNKGNLTDEIIFVKGFGASVVPGSFNAVTNATNIISWTKKTYDNYGNVTQARRVRDFAVPSSGPAINYVYTDTVNNTVGAVPTQVSYSGDTNGDGVIASGEGLGSYAFTYDKDGRLKTGFDERLYPIQFVYDAAGKKLKATDSNGQLRAYTYDAAGLLTNESLTAVATGQVSTLDSKNYVYDAAGRLSKQIDGTGAVTQLEYDATGNLIATTSPDGYVLRYDYDENNRVIAAHDQKGNSVSRRLDATGRVKTLIDPNGNETNYIYYGKEQSGKLKRIADAEGRWSEFEYDALGQVIRSTAGKDTNVVSEIKSEYDALGRLVRAVDAQYSDAVLGTVRPVTTYTYNSLGFRTEVRAGYTNANGDKSADQLKLQMAYTYDDFGRVLTQTDALGKVARVLQYDEHGNVLRSQSPNGDITTATYGYGGTLLSKVSSGTLNTRQARYTRNALGQPTRIDSDGVSYTYTYDGAHRVASITDSRANKSIAYSYSMGGLLNQICETSNNLVCDGADTTTAYMYDPVGRMIGVRTPDNTSINFAYDAAGRLVEKSYPNLVEEIYDYYKDGRIKAITEQDRIAHNPLTATAYTYDDGGRLATSSTAQYGNLFSDNASYSYDGVGRLSSVVSSWYSESVSYDPFGNRRTQTTNISGTPQTYAYEVNDLHQIKAIHQDTLSGTQLQSFDYDDNGNLIVQSDGGTQQTFAYNAWNELIRASGANGVETYQYDHNSLRIGKTSGGVAHQYLLSGPDTLADYSANWSSVQARYIHGTHMDEPLMSAVGSDRFYFHGDGQGSITSATTAISDGQVQLAMLAVYSAWGQQSSVGSAMPFGYAGREQDASGLIYMRSRYYQPQFGRFTQQDPAGFVDGVNRYTYALNSPVNYTDPWGTKANTATNTLNSGGGASFNSDSSPFSSLNLYSSSNYFLSNGCNWSCPATSADQFSPAYTSNEANLGRVMMSEASIYGRDSQVAVGSTVVNRMIRNNVSDVTDVWRGFSHIQAPSSSVLNLSRGLLDGSVSDNTNGATHFYSPISMPNEFDEVKPGTDVRGGLEQVPGLDLRNYRPGWSNTFQYAPVPGVVEKNFKFYIAPGAGRVQ